MIPPEILAEQLAIQAHISRLTAQQVVRFWRRMDPKTMDNLAITQFMTGAIQQITSAYGEIAAVAAAEFYDELREIGGFSGKAAVPVAGRPPEEQLKAIVRWGVGPLWEETPRPEAALKRLVGSTQRLSLQPGRQTIYQMVKRDRIRYAHVPQGRTCAFCLMLASRGAVYWSKQPHYHDNCVVAGTSVNGPSTELALRRWYEGEVVIIQTASGEELTVTPNHPVLTREGWVPAGEIYVGQEVVKRCCAERDQALVPDEQDRPALIEDVWSALGVNGLVSVPTAPQDFHGDGAGSDGDVHVIASNRLFSGKGNAMLCETCGQIIGAPAGASSIADPFLASCDTARGHLGLGFTPYGFMGGSGLGQPHLGSHLGRAGESRRPAIATLDASFSEPAGYDAAGDSVLQGEGEFTSASQVSSGQTVRRLRERLSRTMPVRTRFDPPSLESHAERLRVHAKLGSDLLKRLSRGIEFSSVSHLRRVQAQCHVYNLRTVEGWYSANGIIISNCDCASVPVSTPDDLPDINRQMQEEWRTVTRGQRDQMGAWQQHVADTYGVPTT